jgi:hypothetical protein
LEGGAEVGVDGAYCAEEASQVGEGVRGCVGVADFWRSGGEGGVDDESGEEGDLGGWRDAGGFWFEVLVWQVMGVLEGGGGVAVAEEA